MPRSLTVQLKKLFMRADVRWILAVFAALPFGIAFLISAESGVVQIGDSVFSAMGYGSVVVGLLSSLLLISVTVALTVTSVVSKEIDTGLDCMYITKVKSRGQLFLSKMIAIDIMVISMFLLLILSAVLGWAVFLRGSDFGSEHIWGSTKSETFTLLYTFAGSFLEALVMTRLYILFSLCFKYSKAIVFSFVAVVMLKLVSSIEMIQLWIPSYIGSGAHLNEYVGQELLKYGLFGIGLMAAYTALLSIADYCIYQKMDLSR